MPRSKRSSESLPEFFVDRCVGKRVPRALTEAGWRVHLLSDVYPNDGQDVSDPEWVRLGLSRGWSLLTQDRRIRTQAPVLEWVRESGGTIHCLSSGNLHVDECADRLLRHQAKIWRYAMNGPAGFYVVYADKVVRRWPTTRDP